MIRLTSILAFALVFGGHTYLHANTPTSQKSHTKQAPTTRPTTNAATSAPNPKKDPGAQLRQRVVEVKLKNGMLFLLVRREGPPTFAANIRVRAGGVDEQIGYTGLAHIFEHMAFKGTTVVGSKNWKKEKASLQMLQKVGEAISRETIRQKGKSTQRLLRLKALFRMLQRKHQQYVRKGEFTRIYESNGGTGLNATTGKDLTSYFLSLPSNRLELWARQEAARLTAPVFREFYKERSVVVEERRMAMSRASQRLYEAFMATAFIAHPYRLPTVGWMSDITTIPLQQMRDFFKTYYTPANMVGAIVGNIDIKKTKAILESTFGLIPKGPKPPPVRTREPKQQGERRVNVTFHTNPQIMIGYHKPTAPHPHDDVFDVIEVLLTAGPSSRLYKKLVKGRFAQKVWTSSLPGARFPNVFTIGATPMAPHTTKKLEALIYAELERLKNEPVGQKELQKVYNISAMRFLRGLRSNKGLADQLSYFQATVGDWRYATKHNKRLKRVTPKLIMEVARTYFKATNRTVATLVQTQSKDGSALLGRRRQMQRRRRRKAPKRPAPMTAAQRKAFFAYVRSLPKAPPATIRALPKGLTLHPNKAKKPKLPFQPPKPTIVTLPNGIKLYLLEDHELPLIDVHVMVKTGRIYDPIEKVGLAEMTGAVMRSGGFGSLKGDTLDEQLAFKAAKLSNSISSEHGYAHLSVHTKDMKWGFNRLLGMLRTPRFPADKIVLQGAKMIEAYRRRYDNPFRLAFRKFRTLLYGKNSRWSKAPSPHSIHNIKRQDLVAFHNMYYHPNHMSFAIVGDFKTKDMIAHMKKWTKSWKPKKITFPTLKPLPKRTKPMIALVRRRLPQTLIVVGHLGPKRHTKGLLAGKVMNHILGGPSFASRLVSEIRTKRGLAYFAASSLDDGRDRGTFVAFTGTRPDKTGKTLRLLTGILKNMHTKGDVSTQELTLARQTLLNSFIFKFNSPAQIVFRKAYYDYYGYPSNYLELYKKRLTTLTKKDIKTAAKTFIDPSQFVIMVVGWDPAFDEPLSNFGKVLKMSLQD